MGKQGGKEGRGERACHGERAGRLPDMSVVVVGAMRGALFLRRGDHIRAAKFHFAD